MSIDIGAAAPITIIDDVRHAGPDDVLSSVVLANVSRALANRDQQIVTAFNALVAGLKNSNVLVPIVLPVTSVPALGTVRVGNFRIPAGYQAAVFNAAISSLPVATSCQLQVIYSAGTYGQDGSGNGVTTLVTTTTEYVAAGSFVGQGELIFNLVSTAPQRLAVTSSIILLVTKVV